MRKKSEPSFQDDCASTFHEQGSSVEPSFVVAVPIIADLAWEGVVLSAPLLGVMQTIRDGHRLIFWAGVLAATRPHGQLFFPVE